MLSCKEVSILFSQSFERDLPLHQRLAIRLHVAMCSMCRYGRKQVLLMRSLFQQYARAVEAAEVSDVTLPEDAKTRIRDSLARQ